MADQSVNIDTLTRGIENLNTLDIQIGGDDQATWVAPSGEQGMSFNHGMRKLFENGGLPAVPFKTKALMTASTLANDSYAMVTDGGADNGLYVKTAGSWVKSDYDPVMQAEADATTKANDAKTQAVAIATDLAAADATTKANAAKDAATRVEGFLKKPEVFFDSEIIVNAQELTVTYPSGVAMDGKSLPQYFAAATLDFSVVNKTKLDYYDYTTNSFVQKLGTNSVMPVDSSAVKVGSSFRGVFASEYLYKIASTDTVGTSEAPTSQTLYESLSNPLCNVNIKLVGDSITWGVGATGTTAGSNTGTLLTAIRNTTDASVSPTWANLLSHYLLSTFSGGNINHEGLGVVSAESSSVATFSRHAGLFNFKDSSGKVYSDNEVMAGVEIDATTFSNEEFIDLGYQGSSTYSEFSFNVKASSFDIYYATLSHGDPSSYFFSVYIDGVFKERVALYSYPAKGNQVKTITLPNGNMHKITIKNESTVNKSARLQYIEISKKISIANDGISGSTSYSWLTSVKMADSVKPDDDYVFIQLGTNDRIKNSRNSKSLLARNLKALVGIANTNTNGKAKFIIMAANDVTQNELPDSSSYFMSMRDVNGIVKAVASSLDLPFISHYENTVQHKLDGTVVLSDGLHPNDFGHRLAFDLIKRFIINRGFNS